MKQLEELCGLVRRWNSTIQLVAPGDLALLETRHVANSRLLDTFIDHLNPRSIIDLGSGGGFPGLVVAIVSGIPVHLVEADRRKAEFLRDATRQLRLDATVHAIRANALRIKSDVVIARAVAALPLLWQMSRPLLTSCGVGLFLKGAAAVEEMRQTPADALRWSFRDGTVVEMHR